MDIKSLNVPVLGAGVAIVMLANFGWGFLNWNASKDDLRPTQEQVIVLQETLTTLASDNKISRENSQRELSIEMARLLGDGYAQLCDETMPSAQRQRLTDVLIPMWAEEYHALTNRTFPVGRCP